MLSQESYNHDRKFQKVFIVALSLWPTGYKGTVIYFLFILFIHFFNVLSLSLLEIMAQALSRTRRSHLTAMRLQQGAVVSFFSALIKKKNCRALSVGPFLKKKKSKQTENTTSQAAVQMQMQSSEKQNTKNIYHLFRAATTSLCACDMQRRSEYDQNGENGSSLRH